MFGITDLGLFVAAGLLLNITPGVDMLYVIHRAGRHGLKAGFMAGLGIAGGCMIHIVFAVIGLSALLATSSAAFTVIKYLGAAYLIYLGLTMIFVKSQNSIHTLMDESPALVDIFKQGILINLLNPKIALFFLAFIPQFIDFNSHQKPLAFLILGLIFNINSTVILTMIAWLTVKSRDKFLMSGSNMYIAKILGAGFIALGVRLAMDL